MEVSHGWPMSVPTKLFISWFMDHLGHNPEAVAPRRPTWSHGSHFCTLCPGDNEIGGKWCDGDDISHHSRTSPVQRGLQNLLDFLENQRNNESINIKAILKKKTFQTYDLVLDCFGTHVSLALESALFRRHQQPFCQGFDHHILVCW